MLAALTMVVLAGAVEVDPTPKFIAQLELIAPGAVADFTAADEAAARREFAKAAELLARVHAAAPGFAPAIRREAFALASLGKFDRAVELAEESKRLDASFGSDFTLGLVLMMRKGQGDLSRAGQAINDALLQQPDDVQANLARCQILGSNKNSGASPCFEELVGRFPGHALVQFYGALVAAEHGDWSQSRNRLEAARGLGLESATYLDFLAQLDEAQPFHERHWPTVLWALGLWGALWLLLIGAGAALSTLTLAEARRLPTLQTGQAIGGSAFLRRCYSVVIGASVIFYYLSLPLVLLTVVGAGGGIVYGFMMAGAIPIKLAAIIGITVLVTLFAVLKSLFVRQKDVDPGHKLDAAEQPALRALLVEVAAKIGTRPVDNVYLTPGADLAVLERGSLRRQLGGHSERCLVLGVAVLDGMTLGQLRSVLAHEYGHFSNRDTAGGGLGLSVRRSSLVDHDGAGTGRRRRGCLVQPGLAIPQRVLPRVPADFPGSDSVAGSARGPVGRLCLWIRELRRRADPRDQTDDSLRRACQCNHQGSAREQGAAGEPVCLRAHRRGRDLAGRRGGHRGDELRAIPL